jgi:XRE family aerobic/anaerobic benzoate catabolism transcriptional regulator
MDRVPPPPAVEDAELAPLADGDGEDAAFLAQLGERIRTLRARRGMTRKILARDSGVSERYLAQLEMGLGNISILRLRQVAHAMGLPLAEVIRVGPEQSPELTLLVHTVSRLAPSQLAEARSLLMSTFAAGTRRGRIALIGLRGAGKTTLGGMAARALNIPFLEMGTLIEQEAGTTVSEIFSLYGQAAYRRFEARALQNAIAGHERFILVPGGSIVSEPATFDVLLSSCFTVWIKASSEEHMARVIAQGDQRPMSDNRESMKDLERILAGREAMYIKADATLDTSGKTIEQSFAELLKLLPG